MYKSYMINVLYLAAEANQSVLPLIANVIKNNITSSVIHIIVCLLKIE